jgi:hypothetical protein
VAGDEGARLGASAERAGAPRSPGAWIGGSAGVESALASDLTTQWTRRDGVAAIVPVIDCGDRVVFSLEVTKAQDAPAVLRPIERALEAVFGDPKFVPDALELRTDHGPQYTGADAEELCERWHLTHTFAPVGRPLGNAVAERFLQTLKVELLWTQDFETIAELRDAIATWLETITTSDLTSPSAGRRPRDGDNKSHRPTSGRVIQPPGVSRASGCQENWETGHVSRANQAAALAKISCSSRSLRFSRRNRVSSSRSALVRLSWRLPESRSACATQFRIVCSDGSNSAASSAGLRPERTIDTSRRRNSGEYDLRLPCCRRFGMWTPFDPNVGVSTKPGQLQFSISQRS